MTGALSRRSIVVKHYTVDYFYFVSFSLIFARRDAISDWENNDRFAILEKIRVSITRYVLNPVLGECRRYIRWTRSWKNIDKYKIQRCTNLCTSSVGYVKVYKINRIMLIVCWSSILNANSPVTEYLARCDFSCRIISVYIDSWDWLYIKNLNQSSQFIGYLGRILSKMSAKEVYVLTRPKYFPRKV